MMKQQNSYFGRRTGFTLLETLVALTIVATGIVSILLLFPIALERHRVSVIRTATTSIARSQLGQVRSGDTDATFHQWLRTEQMQLLEGTALPERDYVRAWVVSSQPMGEINLGLYRVTLALRLWDGRVEYYTTYVTDR